MVKIHWKYKSIPRRIKESLKWNWMNFKLTIKSLFYNYFLSQAYIADVLMEPMLWFVDNFTKFLGPFFVFFVCALTAYVVIVAHWLGLPFWWKKSKVVTICLVSFGYWLLFNICFHYFMAATTLPGYPPEGALIPEAASICKKCISPKPPRTHHCSICNRCILKMDHHCPWLNNCIGYYNQRYFFLYMVFMVIGVVFVMLFGAEIAYKEIWLAVDDHTIREEGSGDGDELDGHPLHINDSALASIISGELFAKETRHDWAYTSIISVAFLCSGVFAALGSLSIKHARLISRGETSIEAYINESETKRLAALNKEYVNPYNLGFHRNWRQFFGMNGARGWRHILLPSPHRPLGDGLTWHTLMSESEDEEEIRISKEP